MDADMLSLDLVFGILLWLPVASLMRLKAVCKGWCFLIQSSDFVYRHHQHVADDGHIRFLSVRTQYDANWQRTFGCTLHPSMVSSTTKDIPISLSIESLEFPDIHSPYHLQQIKLVSSCNGIICLSQDRALCLWNPATKQATHLPSLPVPPFQCYVAFGFDAQADDYKVLCLDTYKPNPTVHLYSLFSDSWKSIDSPVSSHTFIDGELKTPYRNQFYCCWLENALLSFDFGNETFRTISSPEDGALGEPWDVFIIRESIACVNLVRDSAGVACGYDIWMLDGFNVKEYWTKLYTLASSLVDTSFDLYWTMGFSKNGDFLLLPREIYATASFYNLATQEITDLSFEVYQCLPYEESLVSLKRGNSATDIVDLKDWRGIMVNNPSMIGSNSWGDTDISEDVLFQILLWLPVVSLLRFMSVCKSWCARIKSSYFAAQYLHLHHHQNINDSVNFILHSDNPCNFPLFEDSSRYTSCTCVLSADKFEVLDFPYSECWSCEMIIICTSFDGIICLKWAYEAFLYLWNPATKQFKVIEPFVREVYCFTGFGLDVKTNNYKLVSIYLGRLALVSVYSLNTDSWKTLDDEIVSTFKSIGSGLPVPYQKGICCCLAGTVAGTGSHILSFDLSQEVFGAVELPDSIKILNLDFHFLTLSVLRDKIACTSTDRDYWVVAENWHCEIWILNEFGVKESWTKLYTVGPFSSSWLMKVEYSMENKDFLLLENDGQLYTHDLVTQETKRVPIQIKGPQNYEVVFYKESLVRI